MNTKNFESLYKREGKNYKFEGFEFTIEEKLPINEMNMFVGNVIAGCMDETGVIDPIGYDLSMVVCMMNYYTDIKLPKDNDEIDMTFVYDVAIASGLGNYVRNRVDDTQFKLIESIIQKHSENLKYKNSFNYKLSELIEKVKDFDISKITEQLSNVDVDELKKLSETAESLGMK